MDKSVSLKDQISHKLQTILGRYIAGTAILILILAMLSVAFFHHRQLDQYQALVSTKLSAELTALVREADSVGNSSVVWTGLTDSAGREAYLEPLLDRINRNSLHHIDLLDYRGRDYIISKKSASAPRLSVEAIRRTIDTSSVQAELRSSPQGTVLLFSLPIKAPFADGLLGIMLTHVNLDQELASLNLPTDLDIRYGLQDDPSGGFGQAWLTRSARVAVHSGQLDLPLYVAMSQPIWGRMLLVLAFVLLLLGSGYALFRSLSKWAASFSRVLTDRIDRLVQVTSRAATHGDAHVEQDTVGDEVSAMFDAVQSIVLRQREINQRLLVSSRVFETAAEAILITDRDGRIADVNEALLRITGYSREEVMGQPAGLLYRSHDTAQESRSIGEAVRRTGEWRGETHVMTRDHAQIPVMMAVSSLADEHHNNLGNVAIISDVREIKQVEARLRELIYQDPLTGLPNYHAFTEFMEHRFENDARQQVTRRFALLFIDLDYLKHINDTYGHAQGDQVIAQFARHLAQSLPQPHFLCRRSGDEFIAVLDIDEDSAVLKERMQAALPSLLHEVRFTADSLGQASFSVGAAVYPEHADNIKDLLVLADSALLFAKEAGRACVTWLDTAIIARIQRRHALEIRLEDAVRERWIVPHYQPEIDMRDGRITGFEVLARWHDAELGDVSPGEFIAIAEDKGLIDRITEIMLDKLVVDLPVIRARFADAKVAINASPRLLADQRMFQLLSAHLGTGGEAHAGLILEVTESDLMQSMEDATVQLASIIGMGIEVALDDFGKEYSSLSRLANLPIHKLKIDSSFVAALGNEGNAKVVSSIMALAHTLQLDVTAEGVEQAFQRDLLLGIGCHKAQGFLFARPMPLAQLLELPAHLPLPNGTADANHPLQAEGKL
jgi:diguanylate cyclase (GGDEF)-like protein/PAS domain S-box-containing protein